MGNLFVRSLTPDGDEWSPRPYRREKLSHTPTDADADADAKKQRKEKLSHTPTDADAKRQRREKLPHTPTNDDRHAKTQLFSSGTRTVLKCSITAGITAILILAFFGAMVYVDRDLHVPTITVSNNSEIHTLEPYNDLSSVHINITFYMTARSEVSPRFRFPQSYLRLGLWLNETSVWPLRNMSTEKFEVGHTGPKLFKAYCNESHSSDPLEFVKQFQQFWLGDQLQLIVYGTLRTWYRASRLVSSVHKQLWVCQRLRIVGTGTGAASCVQGASCMPRIQKVDECPAWLKLQRFKGTD